MNILDPKYETMRRDLLEQYQLERVQALLARLRRNVRRYRESLSELRFESLADLPRLPATTPEDLVDGFPYGMFALPLREVIRLHSSVGPKGRQLVIGHTRNDLTRWGRLVARQLAAAGVTANDVIQIRVGAGMFEESLGYMLGAERLEASVIPDDPFHIEYQLELMRNYRVSVLVTTPANARALVDLLEERRLDPLSLHLRTVILSRPLAPEERTRLHDRLFADVRAGFGVPEILNPGLCVECSEGRLHVNEDEFLVEIEDGELLVTTLCREAMPLVRYRTRIAAELRAEKCGCGRTGRILTPGARLDGRLLVDERPLYTEQVRDVLLQTKAGGHPFDLDVREERAVISLQVSKDLFGDTIRSMTELQSEVRAEIQSRLGITADVRLLEPK
ncbi:MAG: hypothetical protein JXR37_32515 [Kiritimatiellae bacterium]|nr:hypothetical protein [Kiritimatiellia bacterium]